MICIFVCLYNVSVTKYCNIECIYIFDGYIIPGVDNKEENTHNNLCNCLYLSHSCSSVVSM